MRLVGWACDTIVIYLHALYRDTKSPSGGYSAHLSIFYGLLCRRRGWITEREFKENLALCALFPGSVSTEFAVLVGAYRAGALGAVVAFFCFTLPGFLFYTLAGLGYILREPARQYPWTEGLLPATATLVIIMAFRLGSGIIKGKDSGEKVLIVVLVACSAVLIETDPRIPTHFLYWVVPLQLLLGGLINLVYDVTVRKRLRAKKVAALEELRGQQRRLRYLRSQLCHACGDVFVEGGHPSAAALEMAPPPLLEQLTSCSSLVDTRRQMVRSLDSFIEETLDRHGVRPFHLSPRFTVPAAVVLGALLVACVSLQTAHPDVLERHAMLRLFTAFFLHWLRINGGPPELLPMAAETAKAAHAGLTEATIIDAFDLTLLLPGPPFNVSAYLGAKALGLPGAIVAWLAFITPGCLLILIASPVWTRLRRVEGAPAFMAGITCSAMGIILAFPRLYSIKNAADAVIVICVLVLISFFDARGVWGILLGGLLGLLMSKACLNIGQQPYYYTIHRD